MEQATSIILIACAAFVLPLVSARLHVSAITLEILFGIAVGPFMLNLVAQSPLLDFLAGGVFCRADERGVFFLKAIFAVRLADEVEDGEAVFPLGEAQAAAELLEEDGHAVRRP